MIGQKLSGLSSLFARSLNLSRGAVTYRMQNPRLWNCQNLPSTINLNNLQQISGLPLCFVQSQRFWHRKKTIRVPPTKPARFDYSGDLVYTLPQVDENSPKAGFEQVDELKTADPTVQDIFSIKFADRRNVLAKQMRELLEEIQEHPADTRSLEVRIAKDTIQLRNQVHHMSQFRKDKICKKSLIERIQRRNKFLRILRSRDMEKFTWLLEKLKIKYIPLRPAYKNKNLSKRATRQKNARDGFFKTKKEKLANLEQRLADERRAFEVEKEEELSRIQEELKELGVEEMESVESVVKALGMEHHLEEKEIRMKRRYIILAKKFERWEQNKNKTAVET